MLRTYSLFVGETVSDKLSVAFPPALRNTVETQCREAWRQLNVLDHPNDNASPFVPYSDLMRTEEGRTHMTLLQLGFCVINTIPGYPIKPYAVGVEHGEYNAILSRIQAQRYSTQGRRKQVTQRAANSAAYRTFRSWWISKHIASALGAEFSAPCPFKPHKADGPTESYMEMGQHFEEWTGHKLQKELWDWLKQEEVKRLAKLAEQQLAA